MSAVLAPTVMVVDDERFARMQVRQVLQREGYEVIEAESGHAALALFAERRPDIVLVDGLMPEMDGFECCRRLRLCEGGARVPVLMITGLDDRASVDLAFDAGAEDFVTKPVHWDVLRHRLQRAVERAQLMERLELANFELGRLAGIDQLTRLANRRTFDQVLAREWRRGRRNEFNLSVLICELDDFDGYAEALGHMQGDESLQRIASTLAGLTRRPADLVARLADDSFAIVLPETGPEGAAQLGAQAQAAVLALRIEHPKADSGMLGLNVGVATMVPQARQSHTRLFSAADEALYLFKQQAQSSHVSL